MVKVILLKKQAEMLSNLANNNAGYGGTEGFTAEEWLDIERRINFSLNAKGEKK